MYTANDLQGTAPVPELDASLQATLRAFDTPTVCNALELLIPQRRGWGFTVAPLVCVRPALPPLVAVARTATIRAMHPADLTGRAARELSDGYYRYIAEGPRPSVVVMQDLDAPSAGYGSFWGEVNSNIHRGLHCAGVVTDGSVRDVPALAEGFQILADRIGPSHAFVHLVDFGKPVSVAGMRVRDGELIHADQHGAVVIPWEVANDVAAAAATVARRERIIIDASKRPDFDIAKLLKAFGDAAEIH
jgi:regulator of RNase E activity RraA